MTYKLLTSALAVSALTLASSLTITNGVNAQSVNFACVNQEGVPTTVASTPRGDVAIIRWVSKLGGGYTPQRRCDIVSQKFQDFHNQGILKFLTTGTENRQKVICVTDIDQGPCRATLYTLKPDQDPGEALQSLLAVRTRASTGPISETSSRVYIDMSKYLWEATTTAISPTSGSSVTEPVTEPGNPAISNPVPYNNNPPSSQPDENDWVF